MRNAIGALLMIAGCGRIGFSPGTVNDAGATIHDGLAGETGRTAMPFTLDFDTAGGRALALAALPDGAVAVGGEIKSATTFAGAPVAPTGGAADALVAVVEIDGTLRWVRTFGGGGDDEIRSVSVGGNGEVYVAGYSAGGFEFAGAPVVTQDVDAFVASYSATGDEQWMHTFGGDAAGGNPNNEDSANAIVTAANGELIVGGKVNGDVDFGNNVQTPPGSVSSTTDAFVARFASTTGAYVWARRVGDTRYNITNGVATDPNGGVYAVGLYEGTPDLGSGAVPYRGTQDAFVIALDASGTTRWVHTFGGAGFDWPYTVAAAQTLAVGGFYQETVDLENAPPALGTTQAFVVTYDLDGTYDWTMTYGGTGCNVVRGVLPSGDAWVIGGGNSGSAFDGAPARGGMDGVLATLDDTGTVTWSDAFGGSADDSANAIAGTGSAGLTLAGALGTAPDSACLGVDSTIGGGTLQRLP